MLPPDTDPAALAGLEIVARHGERIGRVRQVYPDGGDLGWAGVRGNLIGTTEALVPLDSADLDGDVLSLPITRARFLAAPRRTPDSPMNDEERALLRGFYADEPAPEPEPEPAAAPEPVVEPEPEPVPARSARPATSRPGADAAAEPVAPPAPPVKEPEPVPAAKEPEPVQAAKEPEPVAAPADHRPMPARRSTSRGTTPADGSEGIDRYEQRLAVSTEPVPRTRVVLRKVVVTEQRTITVPVRREEIRLVREPIEDAEPVKDVELRGAEQEFVLHEERVVVTTEVVPVERIRLVREVLQEPQQVSGEVWREQIVAGEESADR